MNQDDFETLLASLASQYAEACQDEIEALIVETEEQAGCGDLKTRLLFTAHYEGAICGKNAEIRKLQEAAVLEDSEPYREGRGNLARVVNERKRSAMFRVGIENEIKLWRAWLASQGGNDGYG